MNANILIVEDEEDLANVYEQYLQTLGCNTLRFENGVEAALASFEEFDLAIIDIVMPGGNGTELIQKIREEGHTFPIIVASGYYWEEGNKLETFDNLHILEKPFSLDKLLDTIQKLLQGKV